MLGKASGGRRWRVTGALLSAVMLLGISACSPEPEPETESGVLDHFGYAVPAPLTTTNAGTLVGASQNAQLLSGRIYPAVYLPGPSGQMIPNTDLAQTQVLPGANRQVIYTLAEDASYSDGAQITCTDFLLSYKAGEHDFLFDSHLPLTEEIERLDCTPGAKRFTVVFQEDQGARWRHLFGPGTVLPAHAIAERAGMSTADLATALQEDDLAALEEPARIWREGFNLAEFDPELQVSAGPFRLESVGERGEAILARNDSYFGDPAALQQLVIWPESVSRAELAESGALRIADLSDADLSWLNRDDPHNPYGVEQTVGGLTDSLVLGNAGVFYTWDSRQAFAACVDQAAVAAESSRVSEIEVPPVATHLVPHHDPVARQLVEVTEPHLAVDLDRARTLAGATVRIGYIGPNERKAAMVEAIRASCEPAGITVVDAAEQAGTMDQLSRTVTGQWGEPITREGELDAVLRSVDPTVEFSQGTAGVGDVEALREVEEDLWEQVPTIPLAAQPRTFVVDGDVGNVVVYTGSSGIGWNMDRWWYDEPAQEEAGE